MKPYFETDGVSLYLGDCRDVLGQMPDASVDAVVTDPPYELGFMGRTWDASGIAYDPTVWAECLRVLKPGGHLLVFGGTRTHHRMTVAIEDAGFEIRDSIHWIYGSGFPKGQDIAKSIDRRREDRAAILRVTAWLAAARDAAGWTTRQIDDLFGFNGMGNHWTGAGKGAAVPTPEQWDRLKHALGFDDTEIRPLVAGLNARKGLYGEAWSSREVVDQGHRIRRPSDVQIAPISDGAYDITAPARDEARQWEGWNTALKPAHEPVIWAHKPFRMVKSDIELIGRIHHGLGGLIWLSTSPARRAELHSQSRNLAPEGACASALASAALGMSRDASARTDTFSSPALASTLWSIAWSWSAILGAHSDPTRTSTTATASSMTTGLRTLSSLLGPLTSQTIMPPCGCLLDGGPSNAANVAGKSNGAWSNWIDTLSRTVPGTAIEGIALAASNVLASIVGQDSSAPAANSAHSNVPRNSTTLHGNSTYANANIADPSTSHAETLDASVRSSVQDAPHAGSPAHEPIIVARKSTGFNSTVANVLEHGTGALNIGACRVPLGGEAPPTGSGDRRGSGTYAQDEWTRTRMANGGSRTPDAGRWPTNLAFSHSAACEEDGQCADDCPVAELDRQSGISASRRGGRSTKALGVMNDDSWVAKDLPRTGHADHGGASRFFPTFRYEAKAPASQRPKLPDGTAHPTVKPLDLMRWLVRLVTPPGGVVLDPFAGSGTTGEAAILENCSRVVLVEREREYCELIKTRLSKPLQTGLFGGVE